LVQAKTGYNSGILSSGGRKQWGNDNSRRSKPTASESECLRSPFRILALLLFALLLFRLHVIPHDIEDLVIFGTRDGVATGQELAVGMIGETG